MTRFFLSNDIFDWFLYFLVTFCRIRLFFTVNVTGFNNCLIYIMKEQVFMVLWSVRRSPLVLGPRFVATSQFTCIAAGWLAGFWMVRVFNWLGFSNRFYLLKYFFNALNTFIYKNFWLRASVFSAYRNSIALIGCFVNFVHILRTHFRKEFKNACGKTLFESLI